MATAGLIGIGLLVLGALGAFGLSSYREGERRAAGVAWGLGFAASLPLFLATMLPLRAEVLILGVLAAAVVAGVVLFLLPVGRDLPVDEFPQTRLDERDIMFARGRLEPGTPNYEAYYALRPENQAADDTTRSLPGILSPEASAYHPLVFASTDASFFLTKALRDAVDGSAELAEVGPVAPQPTSSEAGSMAAYLKGLARYHGAHSAGITELRPYHVYTHIGRGSGEYGAPITLDHRYAIAFTVEMDHALVSAAPDAPTIMESARQYVEAAKIAVQLASFIRLLGYPARAHIDGNYRVIAPLVACDAGLGEIGRMGLLMTPALGPRVRLGVVTTDLPLAVDQRRVEPSIIDFCRVCKKCAACCPPRAIPRDDRQRIDGALRWRIDDEVCFRYWNAIGTDCARCMAVCPYSHPDSPMHNVVRWAARHSGMARRAVVWLDDLFYGRVPASKPWPSWLDPAQRRARGG